MLPLDWIDMRNAELEVEKKERPNAIFADDSYSKDYDCDSFPTFWNWPEEWRNEFKKIKEFSQKSIHGEVKNAEKYSFENGDTLYILGEKVWYSTWHYDYGSINPMAVAGGKSYDSVTTAAYIYINEYAEWAKKHKRDFDCANLLSMRTDNYSTSPVGTLHECDGCAAWTRIVFDNREIGLCQSCFDKSHAKT